MLDTSKLSQIWKQLFAAGAKSGLQWAKSTSSKPPAAPAAWWLITASVTPTNVAMFQSNSVCPACRTYATAGAPAFLQSLSLWGHVFEPLVRQIGWLFHPCLHLLIWLSHALLLYVDDLLLFQNSKVLPLSAALTLAFCACFKIPLSWKKLQMGQTITWIGWEINLSSACLSLPEAKRNKLYEQVSECLRHRQVSRKQLDKLLRLLQWILHGMPTLRPWLSSVYDDMHRPLGTNVSISPTLWAGIGLHLDEELRFISSPPQYGHKQGGQASFRSTC